jgi:hypothetical protein
MTQRLSAADLARRLADLQNALRVFRLEERLISINRAPRLMYLRDKKG